MNICPPHDWIGGEEDTDADYCAQCGTLADVDDVDGWPV